MYVFSARPFENHLCERLPCLKIINNNNNKKLIELSTINRNKNDYFSSVVSIKAWAYISCFFGVGYFASCELRAASCELRVASCELRAASCELRAASCELGVASCELRAASR
jgi:hypothetical protein